VGSDVVAVSVPADDCNANNSVSLPLAATLTEFSYKYPGTTAQLSIGFAGATGAYMGRFTAVVPTSVQAVTLGFGAASGTRYKVQINGDDGTGRPGPLLYLDAANRTVSAAGATTIALPSPVAVGPGIFFVGVNQTNNTNMALSADREIPVRTGTFYMSGP